MARLVEPTAYYALVRYRVVATVANPAGGLFYQLQAVNPSAGWPDSINVVSQWGAPGIDGQPQQGSTVLVSFIEGNPSLPIITHVERPDAPGFTPVSVTLDAQDTTDGSPATLVGCPVCFGDIVTVTPPSGTPVSGTITLTTPTPLADVKVRRP